jgi:transcriptional regulator with XRE-family HTH domain
MLTLGERIRQLREKKDLSLRELAKSVGVSAAFLSDVELSRRYLSDKLLGALAKALDTSIEDLKQYDTRPPMRDLRRMSISNPEFGFAFRQLIDKEVKPQELLKFIEERSKKQEVNKNKE